MHALIDTIASTHKASPEELTSLIRHPVEEEYLYAAADRLRREYYGTDVFMRGLIEFTNHCKNDCYYCGIRRSNGNAQRYRLSEEDILACCENGYGLGFRTFVLQGGEDGAFTDDRLCAIVSAIKDKYPDCAITLSIGERAYGSYKRLYESGADRYLLRHETAADAHYAKLHPESMSLKSRKECLVALKEIGYQVGAGFMVGSPFQTTENLAEDLLFLQELQPDMVGIGPFIPHAQTPFAEFAGGTLRDTLVMVALTRLLLPDTLIPATTALGTIHPQGRELGLKAGANVVMPNLSPVRVRKLYELYDNKICTGEEAAECRFCLQNRVKSAGYELVVNRGDRYRFYEKADRA